MYLARLRDGMDGWMGGYLVFEPAAAVCNIYVAYVLSL